MDLYDPSGKRLHLTSDERQAFIDAACSVLREVRTFCTVLHDTRGRVSEVLALTPKQIDFNAQAITFETLKKRRKGIYRAVPVPEDTLDTLNMVHGLDEALKSNRRSIQNKPLWSWSRMTAWRKVLAVMDVANIPDGPTKRPRA